jgi:hypothetical protein
VADGDTAPATQAVRLRRSSVGTVVGLFLSMAAIAFLLRLAGTSAYSAGLHKSLLVMALIGAALQWVSVLLACERAATAQTRAQPEIAPRLITWVSSALSLAFLVGFVALALSDVQPSSASALLLLLVSQAFIGLMLWWALSAESAADQPKAADNELDAARPDQPDRAAGPVTGDEPHVVAMSGGGIRAAAFVLGGMQAVMNEDAALPSGRQRGEPTVVAVSGGSYVAAALALVRTFDAEGRRPDHDKPARHGWREVYRLDDPEMARLRRHTRYLFDPRSQTFDGIIQLVCGAVVNITILTALLGLAVWLSSAFAIATGLVVSSDDVMSFAMMYGLRSWLELLGVTVLSAAAAFVLTIVSASIRGRRDDRKTPPPGKRHWFDPSSLAAGRVALTRVALAWVILVVLLPGAAFGLGWLAQTNTPTSSVASLLGHMGFTQEPLCEEALRSSARAAYQRSLDRSMLNPGDAQTTTAGACGITTDVTVTYDGKTLPPAKLSDDAVAAAGRLAVERVPGGTGVGVQIGTVAGLISVMAGLIRRLGAADPAAPEGWWAKVRRRLATWLPLVLMTALFLWLALAWSFGFLSESGALESAYLGVIILGLVVVAGVMLDANSLSLNVFYRRRLSSAFAVARVDKTKAQELPEQRIYSFSQLAGAGFPRIRIVATANAHKSEETAAGRGGIPMVFGPEQVTLYADERPISLKTSEYEVFAGLGRVSIMSTTSISGAAISPLMGRFATRVAPYRILLALLNVRVGLWVHNPQYYRKPLPQPSHSFLGWRALGRWLTDPMTRRPGALQVVAEAVGQSSLHDQWLYLSDGGHLDNTGLVEAVRLCRRPTDNNVAAAYAGDILVLEASNDAAGSWAAVGDAIAVIRADLNVDLRETTAGRPPWVRTFVAPGLAVTVVKAVRVDPADDVWEPRLPLNVRSFQRGHPDFPRASTGRQEFGDIEFEAYRELGYFCTATRDPAAWA